MNARNFTLNEVRRRDADALSEENAVRTLESAFFRRCAPSRGKTRRSSFRRLAFNSRSIAFKLNMLAFGSRSRNERRANGVVIDSSIEPNIRRDCDAT